MHRTLSRDDIGLPLPLHAHLKVAVDRRHVTNRLLEMGQYRLWIV